MKKMILSVAMILFAFHIGAQTSTGVPGVSNMPGSSSNSLDNSSNPSGVGFGGAMGGANSTVAPTNIPTNTIPRGTNFDPSIDQQRMEDETNPMGGSASGAYPRGSIGTTPTSNYDTVTPRAPATTPSSPSSTNSLNNNFIPAATGVGPSAPTSY